MYMPKRVCAISGLERRTRLDNRQTISVGAEASSRAAPDRRLEKLHKMRHVVSTGAFARSLRMRKRDLPPSAIPRR